MPEREMPEVAGKYREIPTEFGLRILVLVTLQSIAGTTAGKSVRLL
ncbi:hypothetical protein [Levilactobacillus cerevisiae]|nr:hypothetical protein [Levilactobacillus cerevisiae]